MSNNQLVAGFRNIGRAFFGDNVWPLSDYDYENIDLICDAVVGRDSVVILGPAPFATTLLGSVACVLRSVEVEIVHQQGRLAETLIPGDIVLLDGRRGMFAGIEVLGGNAGNEPKFKVEFKDSTVFRDLSDVWQLTKCDPSLRGIETHVSTRTRIEHLPRKHLADLLQVGVEEIPPVLNTRVIVVADKSLMINAYQSMKIGDVPLSEVVPATYHTNPSEYERLHRSMLEPMVNFTRSVETASAIVNAGTRVDAVFIYGSRRLRGYLPYVRDITNRDIPIVVLDHLHHADEAELRQLESVGFTVFAWTPEDIRKLVPISAALDTDKQGPISRERVRLRNVGHWRSQRIVIRCSEAEIISEIRERLYSITHHQGDSLRIFIRRLYSVINVLTTMPLPGRTLAAWGIDLKESLQSCYALLPNVYTQIPGDSLSELNRILAEVQGLIDMQWETHPKGDAFLCYLNDLNKSDGILVRSRRMRQLLSDWLYVERPDVRVLSLSDSLENPPMFDRLLSFGWYGDQHTRLPFSGFCREEIGIVYPFEKTLHRERGERFSAMLSRSRKHRSPSSLIRSSTGFSASILLEDVLKQFERESSRDISGYVSASSSDAELVDAALAIFEGNRIALFTDSYRARCINEAEDGIVDKEVPELVAGDRLVFVRDSAQDVFAKLIDLVKDSDPGLRRTISVAETWRTAFSEYVKRNALSISELQNRLRMVGVERSTAAIRSWFDPSIIGPNPDAIRGIARLTGDQKLNEHLEEVLHACAQIRGLHVSVGRYLARAIVASTVGAEPEILDPSLEDVLSHLSQYVEVATFIELANEKRKIPRRLANRLLELSDEV